MRDDSWHDVMGKQVLALQIIVGALVAGVVCMLVILLSVRPPTKLYPIAPGMLSMVAIVFAGALLTLRLLVPRILVAKARRQILEGTFRASEPRPGGIPGVSAGVPPGDGGSLLAVFQNKTVVGAAMLEGGAFLAATAYFAEGGLVGLILAVVLLLGIAAHFPTSSRVSDWVERQLELLEQERPL